MRPMTAVLTLCTILTAVSADERVISAKALPGAEDLPQRLARHYRPVGGDAKATVPDYELPVDLGALTNSKFASQVYPASNKALAAKANERLAANGFVVFPIGPQADVAAFYKAVEARGVPVFITSDSLLHLYHLQFGQTLKSVEEREFVKDARLISEAIQAEALQLHEATAGDLRKAARLLVAYASVPRVLLGRTGFGGEAAEALATINTWTAAPSWQQRDEFAKRYAELFEAVRKEQNLPPQRYGLNVAEVKRALERYVKAHPVTGAGDAEAVPEMVSQDVQAELALIDAHAGMAPSPLFGYKEDYSQYLPRGHYTRTPELRQYFKALMWYGRMTFLIRGKGEAVEGLIPAAAARVQTLAACQLAGMMDAKLPDGRTLAAAWDRLYAVTAYYVGLADDLTAHEYRTAMRAVVGEEVALSALTKEQTFFDLRVALSHLRKPAIYSGLGDMELPPADIADERDLARALALTQGMRLLGQRFVPDSYVLGRMVYPSVRAFVGEGTPFTLVASPAGPIRGFPRGLDVMTVLGSKRARHWLEELKDDRYEDFQRTLDELSAEYGKVDRAGWNRNMYWSWLYALKALLEPVPEGYPRFMRTEAWSDKQLSAALASWSQLRHDTILYAKQSYTPRGGAEGPSMPVRRMVEGYVEPVPEFYARLLALTRMTLRGLEEFGVLDDASRNRLRALEGIVDRLGAISRRELANEKLEQADYEFIRSFGAALTGAVAGAEEKGLETTIVADVHTEGNTGTVLEEGTGYVQSIVVIYPMPDGGLVAGVGPVLSHYEFKHPASSRLTDEAWRAMLAGKAPPSPEWTRTFTAGGQ